MSTLQLRRLFNHQLVRGFIWQAAGFGAARAGPIIGLIVCGRVLGVEEFGLLAAVLTLQMTAQAIAEVGLPILATTELAKIRENDSQRAHDLSNLFHQLALATGVLIGAINFVLAPIMASEIIHNPGANLLIQVGALGSALSAYGAVQGGILMGLHKFSAWARASVVGAALTVVMMILGVLTYGALGAVVAFSLSAFGRCCLFAFVLRQSTGFPLLPNLSRKMTDFRFAIRKTVILTLGSLTWMPTNLFVVSLLSSQPKGLIEVGGLNAAHQFFAIALTLPSILTQFVLPVASREHAQGKLRSARQHAILGSTISLIFGLGCALVFSLSAKFWLGLFGPEFQAFDSVLIWMMVAAAVAAPQGSLSNYLLAREKYVHRLLTQIAWMIVVVSLVWVWRHEGAVGAAKAYAVAWFTRSTIEAIEVVWHSDKSTYASELAR